MLPVDYRETLLARSPTGSFYITALQGKVVAYSPEDWEKKSEQLFSIENPPLALSRFISKVLGLAVELTPDAQGRVRIPQPHMREANLHKDTVLVGLGNRFEIWDQASFDALAVEDVSADLAARGIDIS